MIRLTSAILWLAFTSLCFAAPVTVKSGEHSGFTRLVLDFGASVDWGVGRTLDGYELRLAGAAPGYDLTEAFSLIGKGRLAALWVDPDTSSLRIGIACACHAIPFEFRPGIVVIDLRDGAPPKGSSFEVSLDGGGQPALTDRPAPRPRPRPGAVPSRYVWTDIAVSDLPQRPPRLPQLVSSGDPALQPLRDSLVRQLSRGAAQGVVDMVLPAQPDLADGPEAQLPATRIGLGELPGLSIGTDHAAIGASGAVCIDAQSLEISDWGSDAPVAQQISAAMAGVIGEFDKTDPVALARAVKFQLFLGFGAEARQLLRAFPAELPDAQLWSSLARILDDEPEDTPAFMGQLACDTPAALWSMLALPMPKKGEVVNRDAIVRAFSGLPLSLRRHLGPRLADRFLALDDATTAGAIRNAIIRAPGEPGPKVALLEAEIDLKNGDAAAAEVRLEGLLTNPGPGTAAAVVRLVTARVAQDLPVDPDQVVALQAFLAEHLGSSEEPVLRKSLVLAQAASGDFDAAFALLPQSPEAGSDVWRLLAKIGVDDAILAHAVLPAEQSAPPLPAETSALLAERLLAFGLAASAQTWLGQNANPDLQARVHLARGDGRAALNSLSKVETPVALALRAEALRMLNDQAEPDAYAAIGNAEGERQALSKARNWDKLAELSVVGWLPVIETLSDPKSTLELEPLARGHDLVQYSATTRSAVADLLATVSSSPKTTP